MLKLNKKCSRSELLETESIIEHKVVTSKIENTQLLKSLIKTKDIGFEYKEQNFNAVILGDSLKLMEKMKSDSVDLIFADEPYNIGKNFGNNKDKWLSTEDYIEWNKKWISMAMNVLKPNGTIYIMTATQYMPFIDIFMQKNYNVLSRIVWTYDSSGVQAKKMFGSLYEPILMCSKSKTKSITFNSSDIMVEAKTGAKRKLIDYRKNPPAPYNTKKKHLEMYGIFQELDIEWTSMRNILRKSLKHYLTE